MQRLLHLPATESKDGEGRRKRNSNELSSMIKNRILLMAKPGNGAEAAILADKTLFRRQKIANSSSKHAPPSCCEIDLLVRLKSVPDSFLQT